MAITNQQSKEASLFSSIQHQFTSPLAIQWNSMLISYGTGDRAWQNLASGRGLHSSGLFGFRRVFAGEQAYNKVWFKKHSAFGSIGQGVANAFGEDAGAAFTRGGLFAPGGVLNRTGKNRFFNRMAQIIGGGEGVFFNVNEKMSATLKANRARLRGQMTRMQKSGAMGKDITGSGIRLPEALRTTQTIDARARLTGEFQQAERRMASIIRNETSGKFGIMKRLGLGTAYGASASVQDAALLEKTYGKGWQKFVAQSGRVKLLAGAGRVASLAFWAPLAFSLFSMAGNALVTGASSLGNSIERQLAGIAGNRTMEFGGTLEQGFFSGRASTERQRALQAIHSSRLNARSAIGNEAALSHM